MTVNARMMSPVASQQGRAEHDVIVVGNLTIDDVVHPNGDTTMDVMSGFKVVKADTPVGCKFDFVEVLK